MEDDIVVSASSAKKESEAFKQLSSELCHLRWYAKGDYFHTRGMHLLSLGPLRQKVERALNDQLRKQFQACNEDDWMV